METCTGVFLNACISSDLIEIRTNSYVVDFIQDGASATAILKNGEHVAGSALIGADGLWSKVREKLVGDGAPRISGHTTYRSVIPYDTMPKELRWNAATLWAGPKCHIVHYPLSGGENFNLVVTYHNDAVEPVAGMPVSHDEVRRGFEHVAPIARQIIEHGKDWKLWVLCDRDPVMNWVEGRVALLGDAAHPMLQYLAQGACMAMEDAVCLSTEMENRSGNIEKALKAYQARRRIRTARVQLQSRQVGEHIYHPDGAHAELRNQIMGAKSPDDWYDTMDWLYGRSWMEHTH